MAKRADGRQKKGPVEHFTGKSLSVSSLNLIEYAKSSAEKLKVDFPSAVFTSGRRTVAQQANAMAGNVVVNRNWIRQTYAASAERDALQGWVDEHPEATTKAKISAGLKGIMDTWNDTQKVNLSRHFAGLAFDVQPTNDAELKDAIGELPNLKKFLDSEGGITIWHAEFHQSQNPARPNVRRLVSGRHRTAGRARSS